MCLFDEAQDADPLMLGILLKQRNTQVIYVGDAHQQIYAWRGAVNAMQQLPLPESRLTTSFRFGEEIAFNANALLGAFNETVPLLGNPHAQFQSGQQAPYQNAGCYLCRTNARAMELTLSRISPRRESKSTSRSCDD